MSANMVVVALAVGGTVTVPVITLALAWFLCPSVYIHAFNWFWRQRLGLRVKHVTIAGYTFCYMERGGAKSNAGPAILLMHGFSAHKDMWLPMLRFLELECRVVSVDMPGHEGTSRVTGDDYSIQGQVARIHQFVGAVGLDSSPYHLVGTSMGGCIAGVYAAHHPKDLCALTLICPAGLQYPRETPFIRELRAMEGTDVRNARISLIPETASEMRSMLDLCAFQPMRLHKQILKALVDIRCPNNEFYRELFVAITSESSRHALQEALPLITTPTHVIWGQEDKFPTGFHGHFRSRSRNDMDQTYRQAARPTPPLAFARRLHHTRNGANNHPFSCHDNRHAGLGSVGYFQTGLGRKHVRTPLALSASVYNGELVAWVGSAGREERPLTSTYRLDFPGSRPPRPASLPPTFTSTSSSLPLVLLPQLIAPRAAVASAQDGTRPDDGAIAGCTTYRAAHGRPIDRTQLAIHNAVPPGVPWGQPPHHGRPSTRGATAAPPQRPLGVADCLVWSAETRHHPGQLTPPVTTTVVAVAASPQLSQGSEAAGLVTTYRPIG